MKFRHNFQARNDSQAVIVASPDLPTRQLHALFKLNSGLAADKALFNLQLAATHISFMLSHSSEEPVSNLAAFVFGASTYFMVYRLYLISLVQFFSSKGFLQRELHPIIVTSIFLFI